MYFRTQVSKIAPMGWLHFAKPAPLCRRIDPLNPNHMGAEHPLQHPKPMEPYGVRALLIPGSTCCILALKMPFILLHAHNSGYIPSPR